MHVSSQGPRLTVHCLSAYRAPSGSCTQLNTAEARCEAVTAMKLEVVVARMCKGNTDQEARLRPPQPYLSTFQRCGLRQHLAPHQRPQRLPSAARPSRSDLANAQMPCVTPARLKCTQSTGTWRGQWMLVKRFSHRSRHRLWRESARQRARVE